MNYETSDGRVIDISMRKAAPSGLTSVSNSRAMSWLWPIIREASTGAWQRNEEITLDNVLTNPTLYSCVTTVAGDFGKIRARIVEVDKTGISTEKVTPWTPLFETPNHYQTWPQYADWWMSCKLTNGNAYALKRRDGRGLVNALYILDPTRVKPQIAPDGSVYYELSTNLNGLDASASTQPVLVPAREIIHDRMAVPFMHPLIGVSPIFAAGYPALLARYISNNAQRLFSNGSFPGGVITAPGNISLETVQRLKEAFETNYSGDNFGKIAILGDNLAYHPLGMSSAVDSQLIEILKWSDEQIAKCFHMPLFKVGGPLPPYSSVEAVNQLYFSDCLQVHIRAFEAVYKLGLELPSEYAVSLNIDDLNRMDSATTMEIAAKGVQGSVLTIDEARRRFDLKPIKGGDTVYMQIQDHSIAVLAERDAQGAAASGLVTPATPPAQEPTTTSTEPPEDATPTAKMLVLAKAAQIALRNTRKQAAA